MKENWKLDLAKKEKPTEKRMVTALNQRLYYYPLLELNVSLFFSPSLYNGVYGGGLELSPSAESSGSEAPPSSPDRLRLSGVFSSPPSRSPREPVGKRRGLINN